MGAAGDMLGAALLELLPDPEAFEARANALGLPGVTFRAVKSEKRGVSGTHMEVLVHGEEEGAGHDAHHGKHHEEGHEDQDAHHGGHHHHHRSLGDIESIIEALSVSDFVKENAVCVYKLIAEAESSVHGKSVEEVHFHEVGMLDAVADIVLFCMLIEELGVSRIMASPIHTGYGQISCAHGILPVPAPATAYLLKGIPVYAGSIEGELCTPTGAAILKHFAGEYGPMPLMTVEKIGYGMGMKDFEAVNCVRVLLGESSVGSGADILELSCNIDDMTAEEISFAADTLFQAGALDVFEEPIIMKKSRPGTKLTCLCRCEEEERMAALMIRETETLGVRVHTCRRYSMEREIRTADTAYGPVRVKCSEGFGISRKKPEYEDVARIAREKGLTLREVREKTDAQDLS